LTYENVGRAFVWWWITGIHALDGQDKESYGVFLLTNISGKNENDI